MKINLNVKLMGLDKKPIISKKPIGCDKDGRPMFEDEDLFLKQVCTTALLGDYQEKIDGDEKVKRFKLAEKIYDANGEINLQSEETTLIKTLIPKAFSVLVTGRALEILDPAEK